MRDPADISTPSGKFQFGVSALFNEYHSNMTSGHVKEWWKKRSLRALAWSKAPYGYQYCDDSCPQDDVNHPYWHHHEEKAPAVAEMFEMYANGDASFEEISRWPLAGAI